MEKINFLIIGMVLAFLVMPLASASVDSIEYPYSNQVLSSTGVDLAFSTTGSANCYWSYNDVHNYTLSSCSGEKIYLPAVDGNYTIRVSDNTGDSKTVPVTLSLPSENLTLGFMILFLVAIVAVLLTLFITLEHTIKMDTNFYDVIYSFSVYFGILTFYSFNLSYFGNDLINSLVDMFIGIGAFTHILLPLVGLVLSMTIGRLIERRKQDG